MSYIRMGQDSQYVDLHGGSRAYIYDHGSGIEGLGSYGNFIDALCTHAAGAGMDDDTLESFQRALENHYGEHRDEDTRAIGPKPEMAHIIAQHLESRLDSLDLRDDYADALREYASSAFKECEDCGETWRPTVYTPESQGDRCRDCDAKRLQRMEVSADVGEMREYLEDEIPDDVAPADFHDDEFYALAMEVFMEAEGEERQALHHQLGEACDEVQEAVVEDRPVNKEPIHLILDQVSNDG